MLSNQKEMVIKPTDILSARTKKNVNKHKRSTTNHELDDNFLYLNY